jgi:hypothetical protein
MKNNDNTRSAQSNRGESHGQVWRFADARVWKE